MPDVWSRVKTLDEATQQRLAGVLETRGADTQQQRMREDFLAEIEIPKAARVLDVGCGTGVLTRRLVRHPNVGSAVGVDIAPSLLARARELYADTDVAFEEGDATALPFPDETFDVVVLDSTLSHVPNAEQAVAEAARVVRKGGAVAMFDGNYSTTTVALEAHDPLQTCVDAMMASSVTDLWLMRRLPTIVTGCDLTVTHHRSHGYVESRDPQYLLTVIDRGADLLYSNGRISAELAGALKAEARHRAQLGAFFGQIVYTSLIARR